MNRPILLCALLAATAAALGAQEASQSAPYEGTSNPPPDETIVINLPAPNQPAPARQLTIPSSNSMQYGTTGQADTSDPYVGQGRSNLQTAPGDPAADRWRSDAAPTSQDPSINYPDPARDAPYRPAQDYRSPALSERPYAADPDGDIVHPEAAPSGELGAGTTIRVRLMDRLSTADTERGEAFRTRVGSDVVRGGEVLIPAGAEIDGRVVQVSRGHAGGHGAMRLLPERVIMPDGTRYDLYAEVTGVPGSNNRVGSEGAIRPGSRAGRDGIEYGAAVGSGAVAGAVLGGPVGALTGSLVGAGLVTVHLLADHPQATLESGTALQFTLTEPLFLSRANFNGN
jgi:hypothetical protein